MVFLADRGGETRSYSGEAVGDEEVKSRLGDFVAYRVGMQRELFFTRTDLRGTELFCCRSRG